MQRPAIDDECRGRAEGNEVGERVVLDAEGGFGVGQTGNAPIAAIEDHGDEDENGGETETAVNSGENSVEAAEKGCRGEEVRQDVDSFGASHGGFLF